MPVNCFVVDIARFEKLVVVFDADDNDVVLDDAIEDDESCAEALGEADDEVNERAEDVALDELRCPAVVSGNLVTTEEGNEPVRRGDER